MVPLTGYSNRLSGRPGDRIEFKVSSIAEEPFVASLVQIVCADPNPAGPGIIERPVDIEFGGQVASRVQPFYPGSYATADVRNAYSGGDFSLVVTVWPTLPNDDRPQALVSCAGANATIPLSLGLDRTGQVTVSSHGKSVTCAGALKARRWHRVWASYDASAQQLTVGHLGLEHDTADHQTTSRLSIDLSAMQRILIAAEPGADRPAQNYYDGKIEAPMLLGAQLNQTQVRELTLCQPPPALLAGWDFSQGISSTQIHDVGPRRLHGTLVNLPARAMTGSQWTGAEMCWRHAPEHYGAIHFHSDEIYDFDWQTDFSFDIPAQLRSGVYAAKLQCGEHTDWIPFFVCPARNQTTAALCVLVSTFTYSVYGNHARPDFTPEWLEKNERWHAYPWNPAVHSEYGLSTYNVHRDGSGICHASFRRPLFNMRPGYLTFGANDCSGLRHFQADSHLLAWLDQQGIAFDIVTDQELHDEGLAAIAGYSAVTTGTHPEYHTAQTLDALQDYRVNGGNFMYLGGNGFYWRVALHPQDSAHIEIRRAEGGIRAWAAEPGEYYHAFDGAYGGLWRRNNRPPQRLAGIGFSAQGVFDGSFYRRHPDTYSNPAVDWVFDGIDTDIIGDFGFSGGGAAGFELDRADHRLGSADDLTILASSEQHGESFVLVPEELLTHITTLPGEPIEDLIRADMVYQQQANGGQLFAVGSITFCGSLLVNNGDNNVSQLMKNVIRRFI